MQSLAIHSLHQQTNNKQQVCWCNEYSLHQQTNKLVVVMSDNKFTTTNQVGCCYKFVGTLVHCATVYHVHNTAPCTLVHCAMYTVLEHSSNT